MSLDSPRAQNLPWAQMSSTSVHIFLYIFKIYIILIQWPEEEAFVSKGGKKKKTFF